MDLSLKALAEKRGIVLIDNEKIIGRAFENVMVEYTTPEKIKQDFDDLVERLEKEAHRIYLEEEQVFGAAVLTAFIRECTSGRSVVTVDQAATILGEHFGDLKQFFESLGQSRSSRAGKAFEIIQNRLFKSLGYPFDEQPVINGKPDFVMPSISHYRTNAMDCIIFTAKRTLRERWKQVVTEGSKGTAFYLATIDDKLSCNQLGEMRSNRVNIVCPKRIKDTRYSNVVNAFSFEQFFLDIVDPAIERWRRNGVI